MKLSALGMAPEEAQAHVDQAVSAARRGLEPLLLKPEDAAPLIGVGRSRIYDLCRRGVVPCIRLDGSVRIPVQALRDWVRAQVEAQAA